MSMNAMYTNNQLQTAAERVAAQQQERQERIDNDPTVRAARSKLDQAKSEYEQLQNQTRTMPYAQRVKWLGDIKASEQAVSDASRELQMAINSNSSAAYVAKLQAEAKEQAKQQAATQAQYAAEQEAEAKQQYRPHFLNAGGKSSDFEQAWTSTIWPRMVQERAAEQHAVRQAQLRRGYEL